MLKAALSIVALGVAAYVLVLLHTMVLTLAAMHADISDMRGQLHRTTSELRLTNARLQIVNSHLISTNHELLGTNRKLNGTNGALRVTVGHLSRTDAGVFAMKADTDRMDTELLQLQLSIGSMVGDIHRMTHRIVNAKLLF